MSTTLSNTYFLKAYDSYPFELAEVEEQLDYALAYDPKHVASLCLKSRYYLYDLNWRAEARDLAEQAMSIDPRNPCAAASLLNCMLEQESYDEALRFLAYIERKVPMDTFTKYAYMAYLMELKLNFKISLNYYKVLTLYAKSPEQKDRIEGFIKLVKDKEKSHRKLRRSRSKRSK